MSQPSVGPIEYPFRAYGMDHDRWDWSMVSRRPGVAWPGGHRLAVWITVALEWFPLNMKGQPFKPMGAMQTSYPDLRHYTLRDYGNRVGIYRIFEALERHGIRASAAVNAAVARRYPSLIRDCVSRDWEIIANGLDMDHLHHGGLSVEAERALIAQCQTLLSEASGQRVRGWLSPAKSQSHVTPDLLAEAGFDYLCDWVNDDLPYRVRTVTGALDSSPAHYQHPPGTGGAQGVTAGRELISMPHPIDLDDATILVQNHHTEDDFRDALIDQFEVLYRESGPENGRILALSLHPWVIGQPYRISALEQALAHVMRHRGVWAATGSEILDAWQAGRTSAEG